MTDFSTRPRPRDRRPEWLVLAGGAAAVVLALAGALSAYRLAGAAQIRLEETRGSLATLRERIRTLEQTRASSDEQQLATRVLVAAQAPVTAALSALEGVLPLDVRLRSLTLRYEDSCRVDMAVEARRPAAYDEFLARLYDESSQFIEVAPGSESREASVTATVRARFRGVRR